MTRAFRMRVGHRGFDGQVSSVAFDAELACDSVLSAQEAARLNPVSLYLEGGNYAWITDGHDETVWFLKLEEG